jgi:homoserine kinase
MRDKNTGIKIFVPCSISGFSVGKSCISVAAGLPGDEIVASFIGEKGVTARSIAGYKNGLSLDSSYNSAVYAGKLLHDYLKSDEGIVFDLHKRIPMGVGLSSCAASAVGGVFAVNELLGRPLERYDLAEFAIQAVRNFIPSTDNSQVLSILFGGAILSRDTQKEPFQKLYLPKGLFLTIYYPEVLDYSKPDLSSWLGGFSHEAWLKYSQNMCGFISSLYTSNLDLMKDCFRLNEMDQKLETLIPGLNEVRSDVEACGVIGMGMAGLGPAFFVLNPNTLIAEKSADLIVNHLAGKKMNLKVYQTKIDMNGVMVC